MTRITVTATITIAATSPKAVVGKETFATQIKSGQLYYIRNAYSGNGLDSAGSAAGSKFHNYQFQFKQKNQQFYLEQASGSTDLYTLRRADSTMYATVVGDPLNWRDGMAMTWWHGRELATVTKDGKTFAYNYGADGVRTQKTVDGVTTEYYTVGGILLAEKTGDRVLTFYYDEKGSPVSVELNGTRYYYRQNLRGDVIGLYSGTTQVVSYTYDPWGKLLSVTDTSGTNIGTLNPLRYRGYYYDTETGFYFLQSRYYDPTVGRFINADGYVSTGRSISDYNMFAYCGNDPVNMSDPTGHWPKLSTIYAAVAITALTVAAVAFAVASCGVAVPGLVAVGSGMIIGASAGAAATATNIAIGAAIIAGASAASAITSAITEKAVEKALKRNNSVYVLKDDNGTVQYVGRTTNVSKREIAHKANPYRANLKLEVIQPNLNYAQARAVEQAAMAYYHTINTASRMNNQINGISPMNPKLGIYKEAAIGMLGYSWNQVSDAILYWTGN